MCQRDKASQEVIESISRTGWRTEHAEYMAKFRSIAASLRSARGQSGKIEDEEGDALAGEGELQGRGAGGDGDFFRCRELRELAG